MRDFVKRIVDCEPVKEYKRKFQPDYELIHCILHNDNHPSASVYKNTYICKGCNHQVKLDQYGLIKKAFGVDTSSEVIAILKEKNFLKKCFKLFKDKNN